MTYTFYGQFHGELAPDFVEALSGITVRLYRYHGTKYITSLSVSDPRESMKLLNPDVIAGKSSAALGEAITDEAGNFVLTLEEGGEEERGYNGDAFDVDLFIPDVPFRKEEQLRGGVQLTLTTMKPRWEPTEDGFSATWSYTVPADFWSDIRAHFDTWVVCGRVLTQETKLPLPGVRVTAYDADWIQDDCLGSAITDDEGKFRIDFARDDFRQTPLSPLINYEQGGPDLYFMVESRTGELLHKEAKTEGQIPGRVDIGHCTYIDLVLNHALAMMA